MNDSTVPNDSSEVAEAPSPISATSPPNFVSVQLKGVGGWLLFFVIGQLALRPLMFFSKLGQGVNTAQIAERFPSTATIIKIETAVQVGLLIAGIVVGCALLRTGVTWPVLLARLFLIANALLTLALAVLYFSSDLPEAARTTLIVEGLVSGVGVSIVCFVWFLYFMRSKRVHATYFGKVT
jgi:hypothetical protein